MKLLGSVLGAVGLIAVVAPALSEPIVDERFGCRDKVMIERIIRLAVVDDKPAAAMILQRGYDSGNCLRWKSGQNVRVESPRSGGLVCLAEKGSPDACFWTPVEAISR